MESVVTVRSIFIYVGKVRPCVAENSVCRKQPMRHSTVSAKILFSPSHWLFPAHGVFRHTGTDFNYFAIGCRMITQ
jgi:hypothetical protein